MTQPDRARAASALVVGNLVWATAFAVSQVALPLGEGRLLALRFWIAGLAALPFMLRGRLPRVRDLLAAAALGIVGFAVAYYFGLQGIRYAGASLAAVSIALEPLATAAWARLLLRERLAPVAPLCFAVAVFGTWLLAGMPLPGHDARLVGVFYLLLSVACYGIYNVLGKGIAERVGDFAMTGVGSLATGVVLLPFLVLGPGWSAASPQAIWASIYLGVFPTLLAYALWFYAVRRAAVSFAAFFLYIQPVAGAVLAWLWLREAMTPLQVLGGAAILLSVYLGTRRNASDCAPGAPPPRAC